jgi:4-hydroxy-tetrahydrodipicolinate synthase
MQTSLHGIWVPLVTPMHQGELDLGRLQRLADRIIADGAHGLVVCGTTGEAQQLDVAEQSAALAAVLELATAHRLAQRPQFAAIKQAGGSLQQITDLLLQTPLSVLCGDDALLFAALCGGAHGAISASAHIRTDLYVQLFDLVRAQKLVEACALFELLLPVIRALFSEPNPAPLKAALSMQGVLCDELRLPMVPATPACREHLAAALAVLDGVPRYRRAQANTSAALGSMDALVAADTQTGARYSLAHAMVAP